MADEGDGVHSLKDLQTCSLHLPCRAGEHLVPLMEAGKWGERHCSCFAGLAAGCWVLLHLGNFPKGLHSSDILAESYAELKALYSITTPGSGSQPAAPETTMYLSTSCLSLVVWPRGWQGLHWNTRCSAWRWAGPSTTAEKAIKNSISVNWQI